MDDVMLPPRCRVERRAVGRWTVCAVLVALPPVFVLGLLVLLFPASRIWLAPGFLVAAGAGAAYVVAMPWRRYQVHRWEVTEEAVYTTSGWLWQRCQVAPVSRIQSVGSLRGPLEQVFRLTRVTVTTGPSAGRVTITGLDAKIAADLVDDLAKAVQQRELDPT
jgi:membrane protein YdbS with pleckstrin-like domain